MTRLIKYPTGKKDTSFEIPNSVTTICTHAFDDFSKKVQIIVPDSVTKFETSCFDETNITIVCSKGSAVDEYVQNYGYSYKYN